MNKLLYQNIWLCYSNLCEYRIGYQKKKLFYYAPIANCNESMSILFHFYFVMRTIKGNQFLNRFSNFVICKRPPEGFGIHEYTEILSLIWDPELPRCVIMLQWEAHGSLCNSDSSVWIAADLKLFTILLLTFLKNVTKEANNY